MTKLSRERRYLLQIRAKQLLDEGDDEATTTAVMVAEALCSETVARDIVQWVIAYRWTPSPRKR